MQENDIRQVESMIEAALDKMRNHDISAALEELLQAVELEPENVKIINLIASCYFIQGEFDRAIACWEMVLRLDEANKDAEVRLKSSTAPAFQSWLKRYREVLARMESRNYQQAVKELRQLMEENDGFVSLYELLGLCHLALSEADKAKTVWQKGLQLDRSNKSLLGYLESRKENRTLACEQIAAGNKEAAAMKVKHGSRYYGLAWAAAGILCLALLIPASYYIDQKQVGALKTQAVQKKIMDSMQATKKTGKTAPVIAPASKLEFSANASGQPQVDLKQGKNDAGEELYYNKGLAAYLRADWQSAATNLGEVVGMQSGSYLNREALYYLARTKYLSGNLDEAREYYLQYLKEFPDSNYYDDSLYYLGTVYHRSGDDKSARKMFKELQAIEPESGYLSTTLSKQIMN
ncbi:tetratricopeptide repeat protein [Syntrophomonas curvata]